MYSKLFSSMFDGSLATRGPWESVIAFQQLLILADRFGHVDMTIQAIARRTTIPEEIISTGIAALMEPDPDSRRSDEEGRRIVLLDPNREWGWRIVNFGYYNAIRTGAERAEYQRQYMRKRRAEGKDKPSSKSKQTGFSAFWAAYPKRIGKGAAERAWKAAGGGEELLAACLAAIERQRSTEQWTKDGGQFIPHPTTWLRAQRWLDQTVETSAAPSLDRKPCAYCGKTSIGTVNTFAHCRAHADDALYHVKPGEVNAT